MYFFSFFFVFLSEFHIVQRLTSHQHEEDGEDLLQVGSWGNVAETNTSEGSESEVQPGDVAGLRGEMYFN